MATFTHVRRDDSRQLGLTLIEVTLVIVVVGALAAIAIPNYRASAERARVSRAMGDIHAIRLSAHNYFLDHNAYPGTLDDIGMGGLLDPWGNVYAYLAVADAPEDQLRRDRFGAPINSDFDLYSRGPDGLSDPLLTAQASRDDVVRAVDGAFVGVPPDTLTARDPDARGRGLRALPPGR